MPAFFGILENTNLGTTYDTETYKTTLEKRIYGSSGGVANRPFGGFRNNGGWGSAGTGSPITDGIRGDINTAYSAGRLFTYVNDKPDPISSVDGTQLKFASIAAVGTALGSAPYDPWFNAFWSKVSADGRWDSTNPYHYSFWHEQAAVAEGGGSAAGTPQQYRDAFRRVAALLWKAGLHASQPGGCFLLCFVPENGQFSGSPGGLDAATCCPIQDTGVGVNYSIVTQTTTLASNGHTVTKYCDVIGGDLYSKTTGAHTFGSMATPVQAMAAEKGTPWITGELGCDKGNNAATFANDILSFVKAHGAGSGRGQCLALLATPRIASGGDYRFDVDFAASPSPIFNAYQTTITDPIFNAQVGVGLSITGISPSAGPVGTVVTVTGSGFTGTTSVKMGATACVYTVASDTQLNVTIPSLALGTSVGFTVIAPGGSQTSSAFTVANAVTITSFTPTHGAVGLTVTVTGTGYTGTSSVALNGTTAAYAVVSDTSLTFTVPTGATSGTFTIVAPDGSKTSTGSFAVAPVISSFTPTSGIVGSSVVLTGTNFTAATAVTIGGINCPTFTVNSDTKITVTVATLAVTGAIKVTTSAGTGTSSTSFVVLSLTSFTPTSGAIGSSTTLTGTGFTNALSVKLGTVACSFTKTNDTTIAATVPVGAVSAKFTVALSDSSVVSAGSYSVAAVTPGLVISGTGAAQFSIATNGLSGQTITPTNFKSATIVYSPPAGATLSASATLTITDSTGTAQTQPITLTGTPLSGAPVGQLNLDTIDFGSVQTGQVSATTDFIITNIGGNPSTLSITAVALGGTNPGQFTITHDTGETSLAFNATRTVTVEFSPRSTGAKSASLNFTDNTGGVSGTVQSAALAGTGVAAGTGIATIDPVSPYQFPDTILNSTSTHTLTVSNTGTGNLTITSVTVSPSGP